VIVGNVTSDGVPVVDLPVSEQTWAAIIDTGFNGDVELPEGLRPFVNPRFKGRFHSMLAGGQTILEDIYEIDFPFEGELVAAEATFVENHKILVGTRLLRHHRLEIDFPGGTVKLERANQQSRADT